MTDAYNWLYGKNQIDNSLLGPGINECLMYIECHVSLCVNLIDCLFVAWCPMAITACIFRSRTSSGIKNKLRRYQGRIS